MVMFTKFKAVKINIQGWSYKNTLIRKSSRGFGYASNLLNADNVFVLQFPVAIVFVLINVSSLIGLTI